MLELQGTCQPSCANMELLGKVGIDVNVIVKEYCLALWRVECKLAH
jgi:hypothetical protein